MIKMLSDWTLLIPQRYENPEEEIVWDAVIEIKKNDPKYEEYLKQYEHDLEVIKMQNEILRKNWEGLIEK